MIPVISGSPSLLLLKFHPQNIILNYSKLAWAKAEGVAFSGIGIGFEKVY